MPAPRIPERQAIDDNFTGIVIDAGEHFLLSDETVEGYDSRHEGTFVLRYGVTFLGKPHMSIVPALLALDYGVFKTGEDAWDFLLHKSNLHPRADVLGHKNDGKDAQVYIKELDLMYPYDILVYTDDEATKPLCKVDAIITQKPDTVPERLAKYANIFPTIQDWQKALT